MIGDTFPAKLQLREDKAGEGSLLARKALSEAFEVPTNHVHFLPLRNKRG